MLPLYNLKLCLTGQLEVFKSIIRDLHHPTLPNLFFLLTSLFMSPPLFQQIRVWQIHDAELCVSVGYGGE